MFDVNMGENFRRRKRFVANRHKTQNPAVMTYTYMVSRESYQITLTTTALIDLEILACDIQNFYLTPEYR